MTSSLVARLSSDEETKSNEESQVSAPDEKPKAHEEVYPKAARNPSARSP